MSRGRNVMRVVVGPRRAWDFYEVPRGFVNIPSGESNIPSFVFFFCWSNNQIDIFPVFTNPNKYSNDVGEMLLAKMRHQFLSFF
jgi:hypothetical protein